MGTKRPLGYTRSEIYLPRHLAEALEPLRTWEQRSVSKVIVALLRDYQAGTLALPPPWSGAAPTPEPGAGPAP